MFNCPDQSSRLHCGKLAANAINKAFRIWGVCSEKEEERDHPKVLKLGSSIDVYRQPTAAQ